MAKCKFCGAENAASAERCDDCGAWISDATEPADGDAQSPPAAESESGSLDEQVLELLKSQGKIAAIKLYRERTGMGLKESKDAVEALAAAHGVTPASGAGCAGSVLVAAALAAWAAWRLA